MRFYLTLRLINLTLTLTSIDGINIFILTAIHGFGCIRTDYRFESVDLVTRWLDTNLTEIENSKAKLSKFGFLFLLKVEKKHGWPRSAYLNAMIFSVGLTFWIFEADFFGRKFWTVFADLWQIFVPFSLLSLALTLVSAEDVNLCVDLK